MAVSGRRKKKNDGRLGILGICVVVLVFGAVLLIRTKTSEEEIDVLSKKQNTLEEQIQYEQDRADALEERKIYVKTKMYVEEMAKKLGLVYPDEIIYKPGD